jgi:hypothetical protein
MTFEIRDIIRSKQALRARLAAQPIGDKLRLLDELRARAVAIAASRKRGRAAAG